MATHQWPRSTSPPPSFVVGCSASRAAGASDFGPATVLACLPGEQHDLGLITFGLALHARGWRIYYLGPDTPIETVDDTSRRVEPDLVVLSALGEERVKPVIEQLRALAAHQRLALALAGATPSYLSESDGVLMLTGDPITEATRVTALARDDAFPAPRDRRDVTP